MATTATALPPPQTALWPALDYARLDETKLDALEQWQEVMSGRLLIPQTATLRQLAVHLSTARTMVQPVLFGGAMGGGKLLEWDTMIPTPRGFRMIDDLRPGDTVFGRDGLQTIVTAVSEPQMAEAYQLLFDDGSTLVAHAGHEWLTFDRADREALGKRNDAFRERRRAKRPSRAIAPDTKRSTVVTERNRLNPRPTLPLPQGSVRTTADILATLRTPQGWANHSIPVAEPLETPEVDLPLDPYVLGVWLGDGTSASGSITSMDDEVVAAVVEAGYPVTGVQSKVDNKASTYRFKGLTSALRSLGVLRRKRCPPSYLWASREQRLALLQGLLDTDGTVSDGGSVDFCSTNRDLAMGCAQLARSLGHKVTVREGRAVFKGKDYGPKWMLKFKANVQVFRLKRKADRLVLASRQTTRFRYIVDVVPVGERRMRCIAVDAPDRLYLAGESLIPTHNTALLCQLAIRLCRLVKDYYAAMVRYERSRFVESTLILLREMLEPLFSSGEAIDRPGYSQILFPRTGSVIFYTGVREITRVKSAQYGGLFIDEITELTRYTFDMLRTRVRLPAAATTPYGDMRMVVGTCNPEPGWVKDDWITFPRPGYVFVPALPTDNPHNPPSYFEEMRLSMPSHLFKAFMLGDWDALSPANAVFAGTMLTAARKRVEARNPGDITWGIDMGHKGGDATEIVERSGLHWRYLDGWVHERNTESVRRIKQAYLMAEDKPQRIVLDTTGVGAGAGDLLVEAADAGELGDCVVYEVLGGTKAQDAVHYTNVKTENAFKLKAILEQNRGQLPDDELTIGDLAAYSSRTSAGRTALDPNEVIRGKLGRSPNRGDGTLLTLYEGERQEVREPDDPTAAIEQLTDAERLRRREAAAQADQTRRTAEAFFENVGISTQDDDLGVGY